MTAGMLGYVPLLTHSFPLDIIMILGTKKKKEKKKEGKRCPSERYEPGFRIRLNSVTNICLACY